MLHRCHFSIAEHGRFQHYFDKTGADRRCEADGSEPPKTSDYVRIGLTVRVTSVEMGLIGLVCGRANCHLSMLQLGDWDIPPPPFAETGGRP